jgi:putative tryptophan/tyrosine transport system substrate-binding protein
MDRLTFVYGLTLGTLAAAGLVRAQQAGRLVRLGRLSLAELDAQPGRASTDAIFDGLRELGYAEGRDFVVERRDAGGDAARLTELVMDLVRLPVDILLVTGVTATAAAHRITTTIPIVCMMGDPVGRGFVKSLARPAGNITGVTLTSGGSDMGGKFLQLLRDVVPNASRIGFLRSANNPATLPAAFFPASSLTAIQLVAVDIRDPSGVDQAFDTLIRAKVQALTSDGDPLTDAQFRRIADFAMKRRLPGMYPRRQFVDAGGLMSYGPNLYDTWKRAAVHVDKIIKGAKPGDLPVEQPTKFELVINLKAAKTLGLAIPQSVLVRADEIIQ